MTIADDLDWTNEELGLDADGDLAVLGDAIENRGATDDLAEAQARLHAKAISAEDSAAFERMIERATRGSGPLAESTESPTPLEMTLASIPPGDPAFNQLVDELRFIAEERKTGAAGVEADRVAAAAPAVSPLAFDAGLLPRAHFEALLVAGQGGSRETPAGMSIAEWTSLLAAAGVR